jgi:anti-anti-sigma factor
MDKMEIEQGPGELADATVIRLKGPFILATLFEFQDSLRHPAPGNVIIDLSGVPYIDSGALGVLLGHWSHTQRAGVKFALVGISPRVHKIFEITHTDTIVPIFATQADAERAFLKTAAA